MKTRGIPTVSLNTNVPFALLTSTAYDNKGDCCKPYSGDIQASLMEVALIAVMVRLVTAGGSVCMPNICLKNQ